MRDLVGKIAGVTGAENHNKLALKTPWIKSMFVRWAQGSHNCWHHELALLLQILWIQWWWWCHPRAIGTRASVAMAIVIHSHIPNIHLAHFPPLPVSSYITVHFALSLFSLCLNHPLLPPSCTINLSHVILYWPGVVCRDARCDSNITLLFGSGGQPFLRKQN